MVELRWAVPERTTTAAPRLQYRNLGTWPAAPGPWMDVPTVVIGGVRQVPPSPGPNALITATAGVKDAQQPSLKELLDRFERQAQRFGELWERCQGKGWSKAESDEFTAIRDERLPALRRAIEGTHGVSVAPGKTKPQADIDGCIPPSHRGGSTDA
jgi:hypothetical protein